MNLLVSLGKHPATRWGVLITALAVAGVTRSRWWPPANQLVDRLMSRNQPSAGHDAAGHDEHDHAGHPHGEPTSRVTLDLSSEAMKNLGLTAETLRPIQLGTFQKTISVPAIVVERPGQTLLQISTPMTGVVTEVAAMQGAAVEAGQPLFRIRLTHEDLVQTQTEFVRTLGDIDVEGREIARLESATTGAIPGKSLLEHRYAKEKLEALIQSQREALRLHGLSQRQIDQIAQDRRLLSELTITSPTSRSSATELKLTSTPERPSLSYVSMADQEPQPAHPAAGAVEELPLIVERLHIQRGQSVDQGGPLCVLADYSRLYIEGQAFEQDIEAINHAVGQNWKITGLLPGGRTLDNLTLAFVASDIDADSRTLKFYVELSNEVLRDTRNDSGQRFLTWRFKPGQRMQLRVPVEELSNQIVLPLDAVAREGAELFVYQRIGKSRFQQVPVHVLHRDQTSIVIANDGTLYPGDVLAWKGAHQLRMEIKNKSGGAIDPHAGHTH